MFSMFVDCDGILAFANYHAQTAGETENLIYYFFYITVVSGDSNCKSVEFSTIHDI